MKKLSPSASFATKRNVTSAAKRSNAGHSSHPRESGAYVAGRRQFLAAAATALVPLSGLRAQDAAEESVSGSDADSEQDAADRFDPIMLPDPNVETWRFGLRLETPVTCVNCQATYPIPMDWPEQSVEPVARQVDPNVRFEIRTLPGELAKQIVISIPKANAGSTTHCTVDLKIARRNIAAPKVTEGLFVPAKLDRSLRMFTGTSPNIDTHHGLIKRAAREILAEPPTDQSGAVDGWRLAEILYDFVRDKVQYVEGPIRNASDALKSGQGDCEDMTSLFVALCRNAKIPARMVWIPGHCYPEFYLEDVSGKGHWYPCQAAGTRQFGDMQETRPVMQKGDRFKVPESTSPVRYLAETFRCDRRGKGKPRPIFLMEKVV